MKQLILALVAGIAAAGAAQAQTTAEFTPHAYVGLGAAFSDNLATSSYRVSPKIFGGYETTPNWGVEGGYTYFAEETGVAWMPGNQLYALKSRGYSSYVAAKYTLPLGERFAAFGKLGVEHSERKTYLAGSQLPTQRDTGLYAGLGVQYALGPKLALTGEYERFGKDKHSGAKADVFTVGLKYGF